MLFPKEVLPGVWHIMDEMSVCMTLLTGKERALLFDTGYGLSDISEEIRQITNLPLTVVLSHGHHDHILGSRWFRETWMFPQDQSAFLRYSGKTFRERIAASAREKNIPVPSDYLTAAYNMPSPLREGRIDLGGMTADIRLLPGHTPGSAVVLVPERSLLLTADDWNPCTWLFFAEALPVQEYRNHLRKMVTWDFEWVLCSHRHSLYTRSEVAHFSEGLTDDCLDRAVQVRIEPYTEVDTVQAEPAEGQLLVFDRAKRLEADTYENA